MQEYALYGMGIRSNYAFDALPVSNQNAASVVLDVQRVFVLKSPAEPPVNIAKAQGRNIYVVLHEHSISVGIGSFLWAEFWPGDQRIECQVLNIVSDQLLCYWIIQQIIPLYLLWNGSAEFLHGMAVSSLALAEGSLPPSSCMGFLGDSHAGKSTLLGYFLSRGHRLVSDDHLAVARKNYLDVFPASPYYRPYREGEDLGFVASNFSPAPTPLKRVFLLEPTVGYADVELVTLQGIEAVSALLRHVQYNLHNVEVPHLFPLVAERFRGLAQLVRQVPIKRLHVPRSMDRLPEVYEFIQKELAS